MSLAQPPLTTPRYTLLEDGQGLIVASLQSALGILLLRSAGLITGGTAGLALIMSYVMDLPFGWTFFTVNLPFYGLALWKRGIVFTIKGFIAVTVVAVLAEMLPRGMQFSYLHPALTAVLYGAIAGVGLLGLFRHGASLGGMSMLAIVIQDATGIRAGWVQLGWDFCLFAVAFAVLPLEQVIWSLVGATLLNFVIAMNHRKDWYLPG